MDLLTVLTLFRNSPVIWPKTEMHRHCVDFTAALLFEDQATLAPRGIDTTLNQDDSVNSGYPEQG
ncbi:hypothetical protein LYNGBM3L_07270 [Moorena producens 3L]|uniref:Uncharacterized protein n=2 Tax=Moorena producens TaxID=1155739 RepID=F4XJV1_9CYAN|nr:hypothetical protein LYNGBM3L_07270 [Moorena producens 3L]OLT65592.1 hypothetical protein BI334_11625 [Moorena producens 3L]